MFNNALLMAAAASGDSLVQVGNSALFDDANSEYLSRTPSGAGNLRKWTLSLWAYRGDLGTGEFKLWSAISGSNFDMVAFSGNELGIEINTSTSSSNSLRSNALFRDQGWYHIVVVWDSDNTVATNRIRAWVNGERITSWRTGNFPGSAGVNSLTNSTVLHTLGAKANVSQYFDGYLAESVLIDGLALEPTSFGQYDSTGTFWTPLSSATIRGLTFGTNGFYLDNTTNAQTDASGEGNNFTNNNTVTTTALMSPTQLPRLLWNPLSPLFSATLTEGNTKTASTSGGHEGAFANTNFPKTGKWQTEVLVDVSGGSSAIVSFAIMPSLSSESLNQYIGDNSDSYGFYVYPTNQAFYSGTSSSFTTGSVARSTFKYQICWDASAGDGTADVYFGIDNTFYDNDGSTDGNPATGANPTIENLDISTSEWNLLGIPYDAGTLQTADEADWEYSIQSGYTALNLTNIAEQTTRTKSNLEEYFDTTLYEGNGAGQRIGKFLPFTDTFTVANSALFDDGDTELTRTPSGDGNLDAWTFSTWVKFCDDGDYGSIFGAGDSGSNQMSIYKQTDGAIRFQLYKAASFVGRLITTQKFLDTSRWYNIVVVWNSGSSDSGERMKIFISGVRITSFSTEVYPSQNLDGFVNDASYKHFIGNDTAALANASDIYLSQTVLLDGTTVANADNFGQVDTSTGRWIPKQITGLTMGTNGFFMDYAASGANLGDDAAGSIDYANDGGIQVDDTPTVNFAVFDANFVQSGFVLSNGNQTADASSTNKWGTITLPITTGKWFGVATTTDANSRRFGVASNEEDFVNLGTGVIPTDDEYAWAVALSNTTTVLARNDGTNVTGTIQTIDRTNDRYAVAIDCDNRKVWLGVYDNSAGNIQWVDGGGTVRTTDVPASGVNETYILTGTSWRFFAEHGDTGSAQTIDFGQSSFGGASLPSGFLGLNQDNMPTGESYQTAFSWIKNRDATDNHMLFDRVRGIYNDMHSNTTDVQVTNVNTLQRFLNGGVQVGNDVQVNTASESYVAWNWYMETTGSGTSNEDGSINTTSTLVDTNLGLSISTYTGTGGNATVGHGLGVAPEIIFVKRTDSASGWYMQHSNLLATQFMQLNALDAVAANATVWNSTFPTSTVFNIGSNAVTNASSATYLALCFAPSQFTAIGSYKGNGNANGSFVPTVNSLGVPIQPAWIMFKRTDAANNWLIYDNKRSSFNEATNFLYPDLSNVEGTGVPIDFVEGGVKMRTTNAIVNASGGTYIYLAFGTPLIDVDGRIITGF